MSNFVTKSRLAYFATKLWNNKIKPIKNDVAKLTDGKVNVAPFGYIRFPSAFGGLTLQWGYISKNIINDFDMKNPINNAFCNVYSQYNIPVLEQVYMVNANVTGIVDTVTGERTLMYHEFLDVKMTPVDKKSKTDFWVSIQRIGQTATDFKNKNVIVDWFIIGK